MRIAQAPSEHLISLERARQICKSALHLQETDWMVFTYFMYPPLKLASGLVAKWPNGWY
jgi:hypothetical protein